MTEQIMMFGYLAPMVAVMGLFWNVARKLGTIEAEVKQLRKENQRLESDIQSLRALLAIIVDSRRPIP